MPVPPASGPMKGIGPYGKTVRFLTVGGDAHIAPLGTATEWSEKTYTPVPSASGPMKGIGPYEKTVRFPTVGTLRSHRKRREHPWI